MAPDASSPYTSPTMLAPVVGMPCGAGIDAGRSGLGLYQVAVRILDRPIHTGVDWPRVAIVSEPASMRGTDGNSFEPRRTLVLSGGGVVRMRHRAVPAEHREYRPLLGQVAHVDAALRFALARTTALAAAAACAEHDYALLADGRLVVAVEVLGGHRRLVGTGHRIFVARPTITQRIGRHDVAVVRDRVPLVREVGRRHWTAPTKRTNTPLRWRELPWNS